MKLYNAEISTTCDECGEIIIADWVDLTKEAAQKNVIEQLNKILHRHKTSSQHTEKLLEREKYEKEVNLFIKEKQ